MKKYLLAFLSILLLFALNMAVSASNIQQVTNKPSAAKHVYVVHGLACPFCVVGIEKTFKKIEGVRSVDVSLKHSQVTIYTNKGICFSEKELHKYFNKTGFTYHHTISKPKNCGKVS